MPQSGFGKHWFQVLANLLLIIDARLHCCQVPVSESLPWCRLHSREITERISARYTFDVYNLTNTTSFDIPGNSIGLGAGSAQVTYDPAQNTSANVAAQYTPLTQTNNQGLGQVIQTWRPSQHSDVPAYRLLTLRRGTVLLRHRSFKGQRSSFRSGSKPLLNSYDRGHAL